MRCQANQHGSQVECDLGNPVKRDTKVRKQRKPPNSVKSWKEKKYITCITVQNLVYL